MSAQNTRVLAYGPEAIAEAARLIAAGRPVAMPTETVYGLAADATDGEAVARIYEAKGRPAFNPLIVHVSDLRQAAEIALLDDSAAALAEGHWPGPLTLVLPLRAGAPIAALVTAGLDTIAVRAPAHPAMRDLLAMMDLGRRWQVGDRDPVRHWSKGRVVLLGDAAHPPLQSLAQGACMAIEDGLCLAELIQAAGGDFAGAFRRFEAARILRTARVQLESRALWEFYHAEGIARDVRNQTVATWDEVHLHQCLAWLYDGFRSPAEPVSRV